MALILSGRALLANSRTVLQLIEPLFSLFQQNRESMELLRISHLRLTEISKKNMEIAERNVRISDEFTRHQERLQSISKGIIRMQEEERSKISRELHDGIGQELTALKMNLDLITARMPGSMNSEMRNSLSAAKSQAEQILEEIRELSRLLRPRMLDDLGLLPTLRWYVRNLAKTNGLSIKLTVSGKLNQIDSELKTMIFRIVQEGLNNVVKHSKAKSAAVGLSVDPDQVNLTITDSGKGFDTTIPQSAQGKHRGIGLLGMRDRVSLFNGKFNVISRRGAGTTLKIQIPMNTRSSKRNARG
jgi:two-component system sensor histidine kinase UhpB